MDTDKHAVRACNMFLRTCGCALCGAAIHDAIGWTNGFLVALSLWMMITSMDD